MWRMRQKTCCVPGCRMRSGWRGFCAEDNTFRGSRANGLTCAGALATGAGQASVVLLAAFGEDQGDVVALFLGAEAEDFVNHGAECGLRGESCMAAEGVAKEALRALLAITSQGLVDAAG